MDLFLTVIIPIYKVKEHYLRKCLNSLGAQGRKDFQVLLIDDGSPECNGKICDEYAEKDERFLAVHQSNKGVSEARNAGLRLAQTEWVIFVDADDWVEPKLVESLYQAKERYDADIYLYDYFEEFPDRQIARKLGAESGILNAEWEKQLQIAPFHFLKQKRRKRMYVAHAVWNKMFRLACLKENEIWFEKEIKRGEDSLFLVQALQCARGMGYLNIPLYHYRRRRESVTNKYNMEILRDNEILFQKKEEIIRKYGLTEEYQRALDADICTSLYSDMRLYYFNENNPENKKTIRKKILEKIENEPYRMAFQNVEYQELSGEQKLFVFLIKRRMIGTVRLLVKLRREIKGLG